MIRFRYRLPDGLIPLVAKTVVDYTDEYIYGILPEGLVYQLRHCSMYMLCELEVHSGVNVYKNPIAVVAKNQTEVMSTYAEEFGKNNGTVLCEIIDRCDNIKVEACS